MFAIFAVMVVVKPQPVYAICDDYSCTDCTNPKVDLVCQRSRLITPCSPSQAGSSCCTLLYCGDTSGNTPSQIGNKVLNVNFFGVNLRVDEDKQVATFIYMMFTFFFGFVALALTLLGVYGAFLRSRAESADDASKAAKLLTNAVVGLVLIVFAIVVAQLVASSLGIGSLDKLIDFNGVFDRGY